MKKFNLIIIALLLFSCGSKPVKDVSYMSENSTYLWISYTQDTSRQVLIEHGLKTMDSKGTTLICYFDRDTNLPGVHNMKSFQQANVYAQKAKPVYVFWGYPNGEYSLQKPVDF